MGKLFPALLPEHEAFIKKQRIFFVGSAPLSEKGHINISPKGYDVLRIFSPTEVADREWERNKCPPEGEWKDHVDVCCV